ncbi:MAG: YdeI/OmpD-associated family protein [Bacteroidetes bacterium]|nr:YdeI/OmpD-associated family protein [Bacteroidota bacterium]
MALCSNARIRKAFDNLPPFRRKEIIRYINHLKSEEAIDRNIEKVIK